MGMKNRNAFILNNESPSYLENTQPLFTHKSMLGFIYIRQWNFYLCKNLINQEKNTNRYVKNFRN